MDPENCIKTSRIYVLKIMNVCLLDLDLKYTFCLITVLKGRSWSCQNHLDFFSAALLLCIALWSVKLYILIPEIK